MFFSHSVLFAAAGLGAIKMWLKKDIFKTYYCFETVTQESCHAYVSHKLFSPSKVMLTAVVAVAVYWLLVSDR